MMLCHIRILNSKYVRGFQQPVSICPCITNEFDIERVIIPMIISDCIDILDFSICDDSIPIEVLYGKSRSVKHMVFGMLFFMA